MDEALLGSEFCYTDMLIASSSPDMHLHHLQLVLEWLVTHGLLINVSKNTFEGLELDFLGHDVSSAGIQPFAHKVQAVLDFAKPKLKQFFGMINFYYCFIPGCTATLKPLNVLLASTKGNATLVWNDNSTTAFTRI